MKKISCIDEANNVETSRKEEFETNTKIVLG
jgi:hypothetical protein